METTIVYRGSIGIMKNTMETTIVYWESDDNQTRLKKV